MMESPVSRKGADSKKHSTLPDKQLLKDSSYKGEISNFDMRYTESDYGQAAGCRNGLAPEAS